MKIIDKKVSVDELKEIAEKMYGQLVKGVVDIKKEIMAIDAEMHADQEQFLLEQGSEQSNLWGINLYPHLRPDTNWIEFDSMINIRPTQGNRSRSVDNPIIRKKIETIVNTLVG